jgi:hypothetical protein
LTKYFSPLSHAYVNELSRRILHEGKDQLIWPVDLY